MMSRLSNVATRVIVIAVVAAIAVGLFLFVTSGNSMKKVTGHFASGVGIYQGTPVKILGIQVGTVSKVTPDGDSVKIEMKYDSKYKLPSNAIVVVVANSLVSDRYMQLAPVYTGGPTLANGASIPLSRTASPAELDDIYASLSQLSVALGPNGANKNGALSDLLRVASANLNGNGQALNDSIANLSKAATTLANGREDLFGTVKNLKTFSDALVSSDAQVRHFEEQLAQVSGDLADERADLGAALHNLSGALNDVAGFIKDNASAIRTDISGLKDVTNVLVKEKGALNETLAVGPVALANLVHAYQESTGTLGTRSNLTDVVDPAQICGALSQLKLLTGNLLGTLSSTIISTCNALAGQLPGGLPSIPGLTSALLGGLPAFPGGS